MNGFYLIIIGICILIIVLSSIEKRIIKNTYKYKYKLPKNNIIKIQIPYNKSIENNQCNENIICYITNKENKQKIPQNIKSQYIKTIIPIHISSNIEKEVKNTENGLKNIFNTPTPINNIIQSITNSIRLISVADITNANNIGDNTWRIYHPKNTKIKCFIEGKYIYIL